MPEPYSQSTIDEMQKRLKFNQFEPNLEKCGGTGFDDPDPRVQTCIANNIRELQRVGENKKKAGRTGLNSDRIWDNRNALEAYGKIYDENLPIEGTEDLLDYQKYGKEGLNNYSFVQSLMPEEAMAAKVAAGQRIADLDKSEIRPMTDRESAEYFRNQRMGSGVGDTDYGKVGGEQGGAFDKGMNALEAVLLGTDTKAYEDHLAEMGLGESLGELVGYMTPAEYYLTTRDALKYGRIPGALDLIPFVAPLGALKMGKRLYNANKARRAMKAGDAGKYSEAVKAMGDAAHRQKSESAAKAWNRADKVYNRYKNVPGALLEDEYNLPPGIFNETFGY